MSTAAALCSVRDGMRAGVLTDIHVSLDPERRASWHNDYDFAGATERLRTAVELFATEGVELVLALGDLAHDADEPSLRQALAPLAAGAPLHVVGGNHDGARPTATLRELGRADLRLPGWRGLRTTPAVRLAGVRIERLRDRRWVPARRPALATWGPDPTVLMTHFPVVSRKAEVRARGLPYAGDLVGRDTLAAPLLARTAPTVVLCGHLHVRESVAAGSLLQLSLAAAIEPPFEVTVVDVEGHRDALKVTRTAHELGGATPMRRDPRLGPASEEWEFSQRGGWRRSRSGSPPPRALQRAP